MNESATVSSPCTPAGQRYVATSRTPSPTRRLVRTPCRWLLWYCFQRLTAASGRSDYFSDRTSAITFMRGVAVVQTLRHGGFGMNFHA